MKKILSYLVALLTFAACESQVTPIQTDDDEVIYLTDEEGNDDDSTSANGRLAAANTGKIRIEYLNNETEIFRPSTYTVNLWRFDAEPASTETPATKPTYVVLKKSARSYALKSVKAGWYIAQFVDGQNFKFQVAEGSDGLLIYNEHDFNSRFQGYFSSYGKIKVGWKKAPSGDANTVLQFFTGVDPFTNVWIYAEDGAGTTKYQYWFMPAGTYALDYNLHNDDRYPTQEVTVSIAPGKTYPYVKLIL